MSQAPKEVPDATRRRQWSTYNIELPPGLGSIAATSTMTSHDKLRQTATKYSPPPLRPDQSLTVCGRVNQPWLSRSPNMSQSRTARCTPKETSHHIVASIPRRRHSRRESAVVVRRREHIQYYIFFQNTAPTYGPAMKRHPARSECQWFQHRPVQSGDLISSPSSP